MKLSFERITIDNFAFAADYIEKEQITEYGIAPICLYAHIDNAEFARYDDDLLIIRYIEDDEGQCFAFFGNIFRPDFADIALGLYESYGMYSINYLSHDKLDFVVSKMKDCEFYVTMDEGQSDYLYKRADFLNLSGNAVKHKREAFKRFCEEHTYGIEHINANCLPVCMEIMRKWCSRKECADCEYSCEKDVVFELLRDWDKYPVRGGLLTVDGKAEAFFIGEKVGNTVIGYHQKTDTLGIRGLSYAIYLLSIKHIFADCDYVNLGPDIGSQGLKQFKQQFKPYTLIDKYSMRNIRVKQ